ncbi:MAG TPA: bifunctional methylenetetrahydrofolate dehydrogenase/methenyltetrahydrofolate cyclohydrolase, partial [Halothiobacillaceae bacterium]|nr:bifunctional methylenetetrahydrofolate dehydrogenase/methenyltetrahydrofolate cyclohydrolase [Halothiobacillaceae bacterium]
MTAKLLDGRATAQSLHAQLTQTIRDHTQKGVRPPGLAVVQIG